jgi:hypothetical protein
LLSLRGEFMGKIIVGAIITGLVGLAFAYVGKHYFGLSSFSWVTINIDLPAKKPTASQEEERRAAEARRKHEEELAAAKRQEEQAWADAEANRRKLEAARAAEELEAAQRRRREAAEADRLARARRIKEWRDANGGCDPPLRKQCMTIGSSGGGPRQVLGCTCVN